MFRICIAALTTALIHASAASPSTANELKNDTQPTACDCSNCSAQHCQGGSGGARLYVALTNNESASTRGKTTLETR